MQLRDISWASLKRRRGRFLFALAAVALQPSATRAETARAIREGDKLLFSSCAPNPV